MAEPEIAGYIGNDTEQRTQGQKLAAKALDNRIAALERRITRAEAEIAECRVLRERLGA